MTYRIEVEVVEADRLPLSHRGGRPDPFVHVTLPARHIKQRTPTISATQFPIWNQKIIVSACNPQETIVFNVFDRDDTPINFIGKTEITIGGAGRAVGSRWLQLDGKETRLRIVWEVTHEDGSDLEGVQVTAADAIAAAKKDPAIRLDDTTVPRAIVASGPGGSKSAEHVDEKTNTSATGGGVTSAAAGGGGISSASLEQKLLDMMERYDKRFEAIERRLLDIETVMTGQRTLEKNAVRASNHKGLRHMDVGTIVSTQAATEAKSTAQQVAELRHELVEDSKGALASINANPTRVTAEEEQLLANYHFHSVKLPEAKKVENYGRMDQGAIRGSASGLDDAYIKQLLNTSAAAGPTTTGITGGAAGAGGITAYSTTSSDPLRSTNSLAGHPSALDRKLESATMALNHSTRMMTSTTH